MTRDTAWLILTRHTTNPMLLKHALATEAVMRSIAPFFAGDTEEWGITGLLHDADYEKSKGHPEKHGNLLFRLEPNTIPSNVEHSIKAHNAEYTNVVPTTKMDWALICCDDLTNIILAATEKQQDKKLNSLTTEIIISKLNDKNFAKEADKKSIFMCEEKPGISLNQLVQIALSSMQQVRF